MKHYKYQVVSGAAVWGGLGSIKAAKDAVIRLRPKYPRVEVERVEELYYSARRYWRWRGGRWSYATHYLPTEADLARWSHQQ